MSSDKPAIRIRFWDEHGTLLVDGMFKPARSEKARERHTNRDPHSEGRPSHEASSLPAEPQHLREPVDSGD